MGKCLILFTQIWDGIYFGKVDVESCLVTPGASTHMLVASNTSNVCIFVLAMLLMFIRIMKLVVQCGGLGVTLIVQCGGLGVTSHIRSIA